MSFITVYIYFLLYFFFIFLLLPFFFFFFFFNDTATTEIYTLSLHDALPICPGDGAHIRVRRLFISCNDHSECRSDSTVSQERRSEEHTSELQSPCNLVCRLLLEKKKKIHNTTSVRTNMRHSTRH